MHALVFIVFGDVDLDLMLLSNDEVVIELLSRFLGILEDVLELFLIAE